MRQFRIPFLGTIALFNKEEGFLYFLPELRGRLIKGDRSPTINGKRELGLGLLSRREFAREYALTAEGVVLSRKVITDAGVAFLTSDWNDNSTDITNFNFHANGTGTAAESASDTALVTEVETRAAGTKSKPQANQLRTIGTITMTATRAITEHGLFSASTAGTLWDRSVFSAINVVSGDSIQYTYTCTVNSGG